MNLKLKIKEKELLLLGKQWQRKTKKNNQTLMVVTFLCFKKPPSLTFLGDWDNIQRKYHIHLPVSYCLS